MTFTANKHMTRSDRGAGMVEFTLLVALVSLVGMASVSALGENVNQKFSEINDVVACGGGGSNCGGGGAGGNPN